MIGNTGVDIHTSPQHAVKLTLAITRPQRLLDIELILYWRLLCMALLADIYSVPPVSLSGVSDEQVLD